MQDIPFKIVYKDDDIVVVDKSAGLLVVPTPKKEKYTLVNLLNDFLKKSNPLVYPAHRIDRETSGLVIFANNKKSLNGLVQQFRHHTVKRIYLAVVHGIIEKKQGAIDAPLATNYKTYNVFVAQNRRLGARAITYYRVLQHLQHTTFLEVEPKTGRTNQIRVHLAHIGHPLVGERKYASANRYPVRFKRVALHSSKIELIHPGTGKIMSFKSPIPQDIKRLIEEELV
jgi:23S rRNA pseudouridine1911/1915/1917 synthase